MGEFGISQSVARREDQRLLTGTGAFIDDLGPPGVACAWFLRSPHAHARIRRIDTRAARHSPGVLAILTAKDLAADGIGTILCDYDPPVRFEGVPAEVGPVIRPAYALLAGDIVRHVGDNVALVVAESLDAAKDAVELIEVEYEPLQAVVDLKASVGPQAPQIWPEAPGNVCYRWALGDKRAVDAAMAKAAHVTRLELVNNRVVVAAIETRGAVGEFDSKSGKFTLTTTTQMPHAIKKQLAQHIFKVEPEQVRVVVPDVGGGFGAKNSLYPEYVLVLWAARRLGRVVKWVGERSDGFVSDAHARDNLTVARLALDSKGKFLALEVKTLGNVGAYLANKGTLSPVNNVGALTGTYLTPAIRVEVTAVFTNTVPTDVYRGAGRPEAVYVIERIVDTAARELGLDPAELRRLNTIPSGALPYRTPLGLLYDSGDYAQNLAEALRLAEATDVARRRAAALRRGKLLGFGLANYVERCGAGVAAESTWVTLGAEGRATVLSGAQSNGQGHETALAQIVGTLLGLPSEDIDVVQGDTDRIPFGNGTGGSRSIPLGGAALALAAERIIAKGKMIAGHLLEASQHDIVFQRGDFTIAGTDRSVSLKAVAAAAHRRTSLPEGMAPGLEAEGKFVPPNHTFPNGCHIAEVEIDPDTGIVRIARYLMVHDYGKVVHPLLLEGQVHGGVAQGLGQAIWERTVYDPASGQLLSASFMDYCLPRATDLPAFQLTLRETPCPANPLGIKGAGESGCAGAPPAVMNAILDALWPVGVRQIDMPATPERVWQAIRAAQRAGNLERDSQVRSNRFEM
jgi:aerobic carbon-monoxide dehydrogenase large subunit